MRNNALPYTVVYHKSRGCRSSSVWGQTVLRRGVGVCSLVGIIAILVYLGGCTKDGTDTGVGPSVTPGRFMFVQASPDAPPVDLYVDSTRVDSNIAYPNGTTYVSFSAGLRTLRVARPGSLKTLYQALVPVNAGWNYTIFGVDSVTRYSFMLLVDNLQTPGSGKASLRFVHVSPNAPAVDLVVRGGITLFTNEAFKSKTDLIPLDAGTYTFDVKVTSTPTVLASASNVSLSTGKIYTLYVRGFAGSTGPTALNAGLLIHN